MNVDIYVQRDGRALVVQSGRSLESLSERARLLAASAIARKLNCDIDDSIIGLAREDAKQSISRSGEFVNEVTVRFDEIEGGTKKRLGLFLIMAFGICDALSAGTVVISDSPTVVRNAEVREAIRQDTTWTSENIQKNPDLFLQDQIRNCDQLKAKIEAENITLIRMEKKAIRAVEEAGLTHTRYEKFLIDAKAAYKAANGKWPVSINGYDLDEDELTEKIYDAMNRVKFAEKEQKDNSAIAKKVAIRKGVLKTKKRELASLRMKLVQQAEQVKMNSALAEIGELKASLNAIQDMLIEVDEDPTKLSVEDLTAEDPNAKRNKKVNSFLND